jgi:diadenosine tetraphosphate (Ap4A) HIT family hydrolase
MTDGDPGCPFCCPREGDILVEHSLGYARYDRYPVSPGHMLCIPFRHTDDWFALSEEERLVLLRLVDACKAILDARFHPDGYNIGVNVGEPAGQSIPHVHIHVIPRYRGDVEHARGGIRGVIPHRRDYPPAAPG